MSSHGIFVTALNCIDGRTHEALISWMKDECGADFVDMITEPGMNGLMAKEDAAKKTELKNKARISAEKHGSKILVIAGHHDCAGNPVDPAIHREHILNAMREAAAWELFATIMGVWVNDNWEIERIA